ncbi:MAG: VWA domain-containing protein [Acidobacteria bacterium]|nr:VWA domain-containing protein [Acidobacteriota bacterium]
MKQSKQRTSDDFQRVRIVFWNNVLLTASFFLLGLLHTTSIAQSGHVPPRTSDRQPPVKAVPPSPLPGPAADPASQDTKKEPSDEVLKIDSNLVTVVTSISRKSGTQDSKLNQNDFEILEDGELQEISSFARDEDIPLRLIMIFDTSSSVKNQIRFERRAAAKFFERLLRPQDQAALFSVSTDITIIQDFTNKVRQLTDATKLLQSKGATSLYDAIYLAAGYLKLTQGRRIIVIVSDGGDTTSRKKLTEALEQAQTSDVVIYNVFTGLLTASQNVRDLAAERAMQTLTTETGGEVYSPRMALNGSEIDEEESLKNLDEAFTNLADQLRTQYTLRFYSTNEARNGKFRKLTVRVKKPGLTAKARAGYYAPKGS